jgi:hypothetical protein
MKKTLIALVAVFVSVAVYGQGTINFNNRVLADGIDARVTMPDGTTGVTGAGWVAQLFGGPAGADVSALQPLAPATDFRAGNFAGYVNPVTITVPGVAGGQTATIQMRVVNEALGMFGNSDPIQLVLGGAGTPPGLPANLSGLTGFSVIPEPSTIALGLLGAAALFFARRRK